MSLSSKKKVVRKTSSSRSKRVSKTASKRLTFAAYRQIAEEFAQQVLNLDYQQIACIPAIKKINGVEQPMGITVSELLAMAKMARVSDRALSLAPSPNGQDLIIVSILKRPDVPKELRKPVAFNLPVADDRF